MSAPLTPLDKPVSSPKERQEWHRKQWHEWEAGTNLSLPFLDKEFELIDTEFLEKHGFPTDKGIGSRV
jgi:hypothetical protein